MGDHPRDETSHHQPKHCRQTIVHDRIQMAVAEGEQSRKKQRKRFGQRLYPPEELVLVVGMQLQHEDVEGFYQGKNGTGGAHDARGSGGSAKSGALTHVWDVPDLRSKETAITVGMGVMLRKDTTVASGKEEGKAESSSDQRYLGPTKFDPIFNGLVNTLARWGISLAGSRLLAVRGRKSGQWRTTTVNVLTFDGVRYLVAPRGHTQWVRNLRVAGGGELRLGRRAEAFTVTELPDSDKVPVLRRYLRTWGWEVGRFFEGVTKDASDEQLAAIASGFPVFRLDAGSAGS